MYIVWKCVYMGIFTVHIFERPVAMIRFLRIATTSDEEKKIVHNDQCYLCVLYVRITHILTSTGGLATICTI